MLISSIHDYFRHMPTHDLIVSPEVGFDETNLRSFFSVMSTIFAETPYSEIESTWT